MARQTLFYIVEPPLTFSPRGPGPNDFCHIQTTILRADVGQRVTQSSRSTGIADYVGSLNKLQVRSGSASTALIAIGYLILMTEKPQIPAIISAPLTR
jgi:hypothetical protein